MMSALWCRWKLRRHTRAPVHAMLSAPAPRVCAPADACACFPGTRGARHASCCIWTGRAVCSSARRDRHLQPCRPCCAARLPWLGHARMQSQAQVRTAARHGDAPAPQWAATRVCGSPHQPNSPHHLSYTTSTNPGALAKIGDAHAGACAVTPLTALTRPSPSCHHTPVLAV